MCYWFVLVNTRSTVCCIRYSRAPVVLLLLVVLPPVPTLAAADFIAVDIGGGMAVVTASTAGGSFPL